MDQYDKLRRTDDKPLRRRRGPGTAVWRSALLSPCPVLVCVPVRNEERALPGLLAALRRCDPAGAVTSCFYLDGCSDGSEALLRAAAADRPIRIAIGPRQADANAGRARRAAMLMALDRIGDADALLFTTDADSTPAADWIAAGSAALALADVAAGRIVRRNGSADPLQGRVERYFDRLHAYRRRLDPVDWEDRASHHFGGGANLAVRAACYRALGGFRTLPHGEDADLLDEAARAGFRVRRDAAMVVETSSRRIGRVDGGLAGQLRRLDDGDLPQVAHPAGIAWQARAQAAARRAFATIDDPASRGRLGAVIGLDADHILGVARDCPNGEAFAMRVVPAASVQPALLPLGLAEAALAALEAQPQEEAA